MELDDFKELYNRSAAEVAPINQDIDDMINRESKGPLAKLKKNVRMGLYIYPLGIILYIGILIAVVGVKEVVDSPINWILCAVFFMEFMVSVINYFAVKKLQAAEGAIKDNVLNKVGLLRHVSRVNVILYVVLFCMMPLFIESDIYFHLTGQFKGVGHISVFIRIAWYVVIFGCMFVIKKESQRQHYTQYLDKLKLILGQMH